MSLGLYSHRAIRNDRGVPLLPTEGYLIPPYSYRLTARLMERNYNSVVKINVLKSFEANFDDQLDNVRASVKSTCMKRAVEERQLHATSNFSTTSTEALVVPRTRNDGWNPRSVPRIDRLRIVA